MRHLFETNFNPQAPAASAKIPLPITLTYSEFEQRFLSPPPPNTPGRPMVPVLGPNATTAMCQSLVLTKIAKFLPVEDSFKLRLTCIAWNTEFRSTMRRWPICFQDRHGPSKIYKFIEIMKTSKYIPFSDYSLDLLDVVDRNVYTQFFPLLGPTCRRLLLCIHLHRSDHSSIDMAPLRKTIFQWCPNVTELEIEFGFPFWVHTRLQRLPEIPAEDFPADEPGIWAPLRKLKTLIFASGCAYNESQRMLQARMVTDLIRGAVNLKELALFSPDDESLVHSAVLTKFSTLLNLKLTTLHMFNLTNAALLMLCHLSQHPQNPLNQIQEIGFRFGPCVHVDRELLFNFLSAQPATLSTLTVSHNSQRRILVPHLKQVQDLWLHFPERHGWHHQHLPGTITESFPVGVAMEIPSLALNFPKLNRFMLSFYGGHIRAQSDSISWSNLSLKVEAPVFTALLTQLHQVFPIVQLIDFELDIVDIQLLRQIWTDLSMWPHLEGLVINLKLEKPRAGSRSIDFDELITGIPKAQFNELREAISSGPTAVAELQHKLLELKTEPGISDLKELQTFSISMEGNDTSATTLPTSISRYFGFQVPGSKLQCSKINGLDFENETETD